MVSNADTLWRESAARHPPSVASERYSGTTIETSTAGRADTVGDL
jgi:hypothetical protein